MRAVCGLLTTAAWVYGTVTLVAADHLGWAIVGAFIWPIPLVHGAGHLLGAW